MAAIKAKLLLDPCAAVRADDQARRVGARDCAHLPPRQGWRVGKPGRAARIFRPWMTKNAAPGGLSPGDFSLAMQREVTLPPGRRTEKDRDVNIWIEIHQTETDSGSRCARPE